MYISSAAMTSAMRQSTMATQNDLATAQKELASNTYADLGVQLGGSSGTLLNLTTQQSRLDSYAAGNAIATTRLSATATALTSLATTASAFVKNLTDATSGGVGTNGIQLTGSNNLQSLIAALNTTVGSEAIFGGINSGVAPIAAYGAGSATKTAVDSAFSSAFGTTQGSAGAASITPAQMTSFLNGPFADMFSSTNFSGSWSSASSTPQTAEIAAGQSTTTSVSANDGPFRALAQAYTMVSEFTGPSFSAATRQAVIAAASQLVGGAVTQLTDTQANVGVAQSSITNANSLITAQQTVLQTATSGLHDVDIYALDTRISNLETQIKASYELTSQMKQLSLTNYLG